MYFSCIQHRPRCAHISNGQSVRLSVKMCVFSGPRKTLLPAWCVASSRGSDRSTRGARLASALRGWEHLRYEVTEEATASTDGGRWAHTPSLGIFHSQMDTVGNVVVPEDRIRAAIESATNYEELREGLDLALGQAWDDELESFRHAGAGAPVRYLNSKVG